MKAKVTKKDGTVLELEGTAEEIREVTKDTHFTISNYPSTTWVPPVINLAPQVCAAGGSSIGLGPARTIELQPPVKY